MYERSAIVLERYFDEMFGFLNKNNLKLNYENYKEIIEELEKYQTIVAQEEEIIKSFDEVAKQIQTIQKKQEALCVLNKKLEDERIKLFNDLEQEPNIIDKKLQKIENATQQNNESLKQLRDTFINALTEFAERQKERNKYSKERRTVEMNYISFIKRANEELQAINVEDLKKIKNFISLDDTSNVEKELIQIMINNGKNERVSFNSDVIEHAVKIRIKIAKREAECYMLSFDRLKKLLVEIDSDSLKLVKYKKILRDISVKLSFLSAEKEYIVSFLDNERMTSINGAKAHNQMMKDACQNFEADIEQIENLYDLILKEITGKSTKKAYKELYNKTYLRDIEEKARSFEKEINSIKTNIATVINTNYWRIDGIKHIYEVFQKDVSEKFEKDLSEYQLEEPKIDLEIQEDSDYDDDLDKILSGEEWYNDDDEIEEESLEDEYDEQENDEYDEEDDNYEEEQDDEDEDDLDEKYEYEDDEDNNQYNDEEDYYDEDEFDEQYEEYEEDSYYDEEEDDEYYEDDEQYYDEEEYEEEYDDEEDDDDIEEYISKKKKKSKFDDFDFEDKLNEQFKAKMKKNNLKEEAKSKKSKKVSEDDNKAETEEKGIFRKFFKEKRK